MLWRKGRKMQDIKERVHGYFAEHKNEIYAHLRTLMEFESVTANRECCKKALKYVADLADSFGMRATVGKHGDVAVIEIGKGDIAVGILAHVDVVDIGNRSAWIYEPYTLTEADGKLYGRGVVDDKGAVIISLYAMRFLMEAVPEFQKRIQLIVGTSEENNWTDMEHYKQEFEAPNYGYSPDGNFPIYNAENGFMDVVLEFKQELPSEYDAFKSGAATNSVPSEAEFRHDGELRRYTGKAAHSSMPQLGDNAMIKLAESLKGKGLDFADFICDFFPPQEYASLLKLKREKINIPPEAVLPTTIVPTVLKQDGRNVNINFNIRQAFDIPNANIIAAFEEHKEKYHYDIKIAESLSPIYMDSNHPWLKRMEAVYESYGRKNEFLSGPGCSYAKALPNFVCWGPIFPGDLDCAHMENELITEESFILGAEIYADYLYGEAVLAE